MGVVMSTPADKQPYGFAQRFEDGVVWLCCHRPKFWARVGHAVDPDCVSTDAAKHALEACRAVAADHGGRGPTDAIVVLQRLSRLMQEGKRKLSEIEAVEELLDDVDDAGEPDEDQVVEELVPVLQRREHAAILKEAADDYRARGDLTQVAARIERVACLGRVQTRSRIGFDAAGATEVTHARMASRMDFGISEFDGRDCGLPIGCIGVVAGPTGVGKSMWLTHMECNEFKRGGDVLVASLELPRGALLVRAAAAIDGTPIAELNAMTAEELADVFDGIAERFDGSLQIEDFAPKVTGVAEIRQWVDEWANEHGRYPTLVVVDYADRMGDPRAKEGDSYRAMENVFEGLRLWAQAKQFWCWTASQTKGAVKGRKRIDVDHLSDSMNKARVADLVITMDWADADADECDELKYFVAKNRHGDGRFHVGPMRHDYARGRLVESMIEDQAARALGRLGR